MKKRISVFIYLMAIVMMGFTACDKNTADKASQITYEEETFDLTKGYIIKPEIGKAAPSAYEFAIFLVSDGLTMTHDSPPSGTGNFIGFWVYNSSATALAPGTYTFNGEGYEAFTLTEGLSFLETSFNYAKSLEPNWFTAGTLEVGVDGDTYEFTFEGTLTNGNPISAYYKGSLTEIPNSLPTK